MAAMMIILNYAAAVSACGRCVRGTSVREQCLAHYNRPVYSAELLDHFQNPRNAGEIEAPDSLARLQNPACGDILELTLKLDGRRIADIRFRAKGCVPAMACGSAITELDQRQECRRSPAGEQGRVGSQSRWPAASIHPRQPPGDGYTRRAFAGAMSFLPSRHVVCSLHHAEL